MSTKPSDAEILAAITAWGSSAVTYVIRNRLGRHSVQTPWVLRQLKRLEREGRVVRVRSNYAVMIEWAIAQESATKHLPGGD